MSDTLTHEQKLQKLLKIVKAVDICMLTTVDEHGKLHSRPMSNNQEVEFDGDLWFFTYGTSHKVNEIGRVPSVNASFADIRSQQYVSLSGSAEIIRDKAKIKELWQPQLRAWFPDGVDTPDIALLKVSVESGEYWDGSGSFLAHALNFAASIVTGKRAELGENEKIDLAS